MKAFSDPELNLHLIELSKTIAALFDSARSPQDVPSLRDDALRAVSEQSDEARKRIARQPPKR
ncbi:hypothetical protein [Rubneribacter sp.]|nr:phenylalanyl-tRNA synthetase subunit alpha [Candidatus Rubneribacter avistercoris]